MEEYERLEQELAQLQETYVNKYRNLDYLENELEVYNKIEEEKLRKTKKQLEKLRKQQQDAEIRDFKGEDELDPLEPEGERVFTRGNSRKEKDAELAMRNNFGMEGPEAED